jgi:hypothetical protein
MSDYAPAFAWIVCTGIVCATVLIIIFHNTACMVPR